MMLRLEEERARRAVPLAEEGHRGADKIVCATRSGVVKSGVRLQDLQKSSLRTRSNLPTHGRLPCPQGRTGARTGNVRCAKAGRAEWRCQSGFAGTNPEPRPGKRQRKCCAQATTGDSCDAREKRQRRKAAATLRKEANRPEIDSGRFVFGQAERAEALEAAERKRSGTSDSA